MYFGISTGCFYPKTPLESLDLVCRAGAKYVEIFFNTHSELEDDYLIRIKKAAEGYGAKIISVHPFSSAIETFMFFARNDYKLEDSIKYYERYFHACNLLGAKYVVFHGCHCTADYMDMERYCRILNKLSARAGQYGVYISQENVVKFKCGYRENIVKLLSLTDENVKFTFDIKQAVRAEQDIFALYNLVAPRVSHIHISDFTCDDTSLLPGEGDFNLQEFIDYVRKTSNPRAAFIEVYQKYIGNLEDLANSLKYIENTACIKSKNPI